MYFIDRVWRMLLNIRRREVGAPAFAAVAQHPPTPRLALTVGARGLRPPRCLDPPWALRRSVVLMPAVVIAALVFVAGPAQASGGHGEESRVSAVLVLQAISVIANDGSADPVAEKLNDALAAPDKKGTDLVKVKQALSLVEGSATSADGAKDLGRARAIMVTAIAVRAATGYGEMPEPGMVGKDVSPYASGSETGTITVLDGFTPARGISDGGDVILLGLAILVLGAGVFLSRKWRPDDTIRELRRKSADVRKS